MVYLGKYLKNYTNLKLDEETMRKVKKTNIYVKAFELGAHTELEQKLVNNGQIIKHSDYYEVYSTETTTSGEIAKDGDFVKIDKANNPYPNARERFLKHHLHLDGYNYEQFPVILLSWQYGEDEDDVIRYLLDSGKLIINPNSDDAFYQADLWGTTLRAKKNDIILIYDVKRDGQDIINVDFNLIDKDEFEKTYQYID